MYANNTDYALLTLDKIFTFDLRTNQILQFAHTIKCQFPTVAEPSYRDCVVHYRKGLASSIICNLMGVNLQ